jgi:hypothetical protein
MISDAVIAGTIVTSAIRLVLPEPLINCTRPFSKEVLKSNYLQHLNHYYPDGFDKPSKPMVSGEEFDRIFNEIKDAAFSQVSIGHAKGEYPNDKFIDIKDLFSFYTHLNL